MNLETSGVAHDHYGDHTCPDCTSWVDAEHVANYLAAGREWVYRHALELDGRKRALQPKSGASMKSGSAKQPPLVRLRRRLTANIRATSRSDTSGLFALAGCVDCG